MSIFSRIANRVVNTALSELLQAKLALVIMTKHRKVMQGELGRAMRIVREQDEKLEACGAKIKDLSERLFAARRDADSARQEHAVYLESASKAHAEAITRITSDAESVVSLFTETQAVLAAIYGAAEMPLALRLDPPRATMFVAELADSRRKEAIRESTRIQLENQIRDSLDTTRDHDRWSLIELVRRSAEGLRERDALRKQVVYLQGRAGEVATT